MPGNDFNIYFSGPVGGRPFGITVKKEWPPNFAPSRGLDRHIECYLPKSSTFSDFVQNFEFLCLEAFLCKAA